MTEPNPNPDRPHWQDEHGLKKEGIEQATEAVEEPAPHWETQLDEYPSPPPEADPRWAVNLFWFWATFTVISIILMIVWIIGGIWWD